MILVVGATGTVGGAALAELRQAGVPVRALVRSAARAREVAGPGVETVVGDLADPASLDRALAGVTAALLVSPLDPGQVALQGHFVEAARRGGGVHVVKVSGLATALDSPVASGRWHARTERQIEAAGLPFTFLRPPYFMQNVPRQFGRALAATGVLAAPMGQARVAMVDARDVAAVAVAALTRSGHAGRTYTVTGPEALSFADVARILSATLGRAVVYQDDPPETARSRLAAAGIPGWYVDLRLGFAALLRSGAAAEVTDVVTRVTGRPPRSFAEFAREHAGAFPAA
jgi:uncharacterized protein YbjT (DUF2867 family)